MMREGRALRRFALALCAMAGLLALASAAAQAALVHPFLSELTPPAVVERVPFEELCGVNVDPGSGRVYVADPDSEEKPEEERAAIDVFEASGALLNKIEKGPANGEFSGACSTAVNDANSRIYVANDGAGSGSFGGERQAVFVYTETAGKYKLETKLEINGSETPAKTFTVLNNAGHPEAGGAMHVAIPQAPAVDAGNIFVADSPQDVVDEFNAESEYVRQITLPVGSEPGAIATDPAGDIYVAVEVTNEEEVESAAVDEFNPAGVQIKQISGASAGGLGIITGLAVDPAGHVYVSDGQNLVIDEFDTAGRFMGRMIGSGSARGSFAEPAGVAVNAAGNVYVADKTVERAEESLGAVDIFGPATVGAPPLLEDTSVSLVTSTSATLEAKIDPTGVPTTYHFEYAPEGGSFTVLGETDIGSGEGIQRLEQPITGLIPDTVYQYRAVVLGEGKAAETGALQSFRTRPEGAPIALLDGRGWELVSPVNKLGALIKGIGGPGVVQASNDGTKIAYAGTSPMVPGVEANANDSPVLSVRGGGAWSTYSIMPPDYPRTGAASAVGNGLENRIFSSDLSSSLVQPFKEEPLLSEEASERAPYLRDLSQNPCPITGEPACYAPLVTAKAPFSDVSSGAAFGGTAEIFGEVVVSGATPDLGHTVLSSGVPLKAGDVGPGLYEWSESKPAAERLQLVSILPGGAEAGQEESPVLGGGKNGGEQVVRQAISEDGSRIVWSTQKEGRQLHLYVRDTVKAETVQVDVPQGVTPPFEASPKFQTANATGSTIFFTDTETLTPDSNAALGAPNLYECQVGEAAGKLTCTLTDLTGVGVAKNAGEPAAVQGLMPGVSSDASYAYFVADGVLGSGAENAQGEKATPGTCGEFPPFGATCNLYVEHFSTEEEEWEEPQFIARVSADDGPDWGAKAAEEGTGRGGEARLQKLTSRVSPDGKYLAFMSDRRLTGYDNTDASPSAGGAADEEVFLYNVEASRVVCTSCNPSGQRPHGVFDTSTSSHELAIDREEVWTGRWLAASIPGWTAVDSHSSTYQSRYLSDSGRLFFNSSDGLVPQDTNGVGDVYEYEPNADGSCTDSSGCVALLTSGEASTEAAFLDASENGDDVFFLTVGELVPQDVDQSYDVYDAHVCTEALPCTSAPARPQPCDSSTSCRGALPPGPAEESPASATLSGNGNLVSPSVSTNKPTVTKPTRKQLLAKALKRCHKLKKHKKRAACEKSARKKYGAKKASHSARKSSARHARRAKGRK